MSQDTWRWTLSNIRFVDGVVKPNGSSLESNRKRVIRDQTDQLRISIAPKPTVRVREWKASDLSPVLGLGSSGNGGGVQLMSLIGSALHRMTDFQRAREHETIRRMELQVTELGFGILIVCGHSSCADFRRDLL